MRIRSRRPFLGFLTCLLATELLSAADSQQPARRDERSRAVVPFTDTEDPGKIIVRTEGPVCDERSDGGEIRIQGRFALPEYARRATVVLGGWSFRYLRSDHHVRDVRATIVNVRRQGDTLTWDAVGRLRDRKGDDGFEFCYVYTVLAWNPDAIDASVEMSSGQYVNGTVNQRGAEVASLTSYRELSRHLGLSENLAILPRGFEFSFRSGDHHLRELAYAIDHPEFFLEKGKDYGDLDPPPLEGGASQGDRSRPSWDTFGAYGDNSLRRGYRIGGQFSYLYGSDVSVLRPPFAIDPPRLVGFGSGCAGEGAPPGIRRQPVEVKTLPFDYAIPLLTGWNLAYPCNDEEVTEIGIWLEDIDYAADSTGNVLRYTVASILRDGNFRPVHAVDHKVDILGFKERQLVDLAPRSSDPAFCARDAEGRLLLSVANVGSTSLVRTGLARVRFGQLGTVEQRVPALEKGAAFALDAIALPVECSFPCTFTFTVDASFEVDETDERNNTATGTCSGVIVR